MADLTVHAGPVVLPCPNGCSIPEGTTATEIPADYSEGYRAGRYPLIWAARVMECPNVECSRVMALSATDPNAQTVCADCLNEVVHDHGA